MDISMVQLVKSCCQGEQPVPSSESLKNIATLQFQSLSSVERWPLIQMIDREFCRKESEPKKVALFKKALCCSNMPMGWKNSLLETRYETQIDKWHQHLKYSNSMDRPLNLKDRVLFFSQPPISAAIGSSFCTN